MRRHAFRQRRAHCRQHVPPQRHCPGHQSAGSLRPWRVGSVEARSAHAAHSGTRGLRRRLQPRSARARRRRLRIEAGKARGVGRRPASAGSEILPDPAPGADRGGRRASAREHSPVARQRRRADHCRGGCGRGVRAAAEDQLRLRRHGSQSARPERLRVAGKDGAERRRVVPAGHRLHRPHAHARGRAETAPLFALDHHQGRPLSGAPAG